MEYFSVNAERAGLRRGGKGGLRCEASKTGFSSDDRGGKGVKVSRNVQEGQGEGGGGGDAVWGRRWIVLVF